MHSIVFDGCRGWFHPGSQSRGVVVCSTLGMEDLCARQSLRILADRIAAAGLPVLRFDLHGTGDSAGELDDGNRLATWLGNIEAAARWLELNAGVTELVFIGLRFGATLAAVAAQARGGIEQIVLIEPFVTGRLFARELQLSSNVMVTIGGEGVERETDPRGIEVAGFLMPHEMLADLRSADLTGGTRQSASRALVLTIPGRAKPVKLVEQWQLRGSTVEHRECVDLATMMIDPTNGRPCLATIDVVTTWLTSAPAPASAAVADHSLSASDIIEGETWLESSCQFGPKQRLVGILCEPKTPAGGRPCAILLNAGRDCHIGWARGSVELARTLANDGIASLRFDLTFVGDSQPDSSGQLAVLYAPAGQSGLADVTAAVDHLEQKGYRDFAMFGSCSGAHLALLAALGDVRITTLVLRNIQRFVWRLDDRVFFRLQEQLATVTQVSTTVVGAPGYSDMYLFSRAAFRFGRASASAVLKQLSRLTLDGPRIRRKIGAFNERGGRILLVYSEKDIGRPHLDELLGRDGATLTAREGNAVRFVPGADHNFSSAKLRAEFAGAMRDFMISKLGGSNVSGAQVASPRIAGLTLSDGNALGVVRTAKQLQPTGESHTTVHAANLESIDGTMSGAKSHDAAH